MIWLAFLSEIVGQFSCYSLFKWFQFERLHWAGGKSGKLAKGEVRWVSVCLEAPPLPRSAGGNTWCERRRSPALEMHTTGSVCSEVTLLRQSFLDTQAHPHPDSTPPLYDTVQSTAS